MANEQYRVSDFVRKMAEASRKRQEDYAADLDAKNKAKNAQVSLSTLDSSIKKQQNRVNTVKGRGAGLSATQPTKAQTQLAEQYAEREKQRNELMSVAADKITDNKMRDQVLGAQLGVAKQRVEEVGYVNPRAKSTAKKTEKAEAQKQLTSINKDKGRTEKIVRYEDEIYDDTFAGQTGANFAVGRLTQDISLAWNEYLDSPTEKNRKYAETLESTLARFTGRNTRALDDENVKLSWVSKSLANYMPQFLDQTSASIQGGITGAAAGAILGPGGVVKGAKAGIVAASGAYSYKTMRGAAFKALIDSGVDEATARAAANDEAFVSALIEMAGTGWNLATLGTGKILTALGKGGLKDVGKMATEWAGQDALKKVLLAGGRYGLNVAGEALEEAAQEAVSIANQNRVISDNPNSSLVSGAAGVFRSALTGKNKEAADQIWAAAAEGAKIAAMMGGADVIVSQTTTHAVDRVQAEMVGSGIRAAGQELDLLAVAKTDYAAETRTNKLATTLETRLRNEGRSTLTDLETGRLFAQMARDDAEAQVRAEQKAEKAAKAEKVSAKKATKAEKTDTKVTKAETKVDSQTEADLVEMTTSEDQQTAEYAEAQLSNPGATVVSPVAQRMMTAGVKNAVAVEQAALIQKMQAGHKLTEAETQKLQVSDPAVRAAIEAETGVKVTGTSKSDKRKLTQSIIKSAAEVKAQQERTRQAVAEQQAGQVLVNQARAEAQAAADAAALAAEPVIPETVVAPAETPVVGDSGVNMGVPDGSIEYADGTTQTFEQFAKAYEKRHPNAKATTVVRKFHEYQLHNQMGQKVPGSAKKTKTATKPKTDAKKAEQKASVGEVGETPAEVRFFAGKQMSADAVTEARRLEQENLKKFGKFLGVEAEFQEFEGADAEANGFYLKEQNKVVLNSKKLSGLRHTTRVFLHEVTHPAQDADANLTTDILNLVKEVRGEEYLNTLIKRTKDAYVTFYKKNGYDLGKLDVSSEVAADYMMNIFESRAALDRIAGVKPSLVSKLLRHLGVIRKADGLSKSSRAHLNKLADRMIEAQQKAKEQKSTTHEDSAENNDAGQQNRVAKTGEKKYSKTWYNQEESEFLHWANSAGGIGETRAFVRRGKRRFYLKTEDGYVELSKAQYLEREMENAKGINEEATRRFGRTANYDGGSRRTTPGGDLLDQNRGRRVAVFGQAIREELSNDTGRSEQGADGRAYAGLKQTEYSDEAAEESGASFITFSNDYAAVRNFMKEGDTDETDPGKKDFSVDSEGNQLSAEQQEFFKDSKVRDKDGKLLKVFHGGTVGTVFDTDRGGNGDTQYGPGAYFTDSKNYAREYSYYRGGDVRPYYLNIRKLFDDTNMDVTVQTEEWARLEDILRSKGFDEHKIERAKTDGFAYISNWLRLKTGTKGIGSWVMSGEVNAMLREAGFDGVRGVLNDVHQYVVFDPSQAKLTTNATPTSDPDIRYSVDMTDLSEADQAEANAILGRLKNQARFAKYGTSAYGAYTAERMDREIRNSSSSTVMDYAKSYIAWVEPVDFIHATTTNADGRAQLKKEAGTLDLEKLRNETQPIHLTVDFEDGRIVGHEGRHRMLALQDAGVDRVAVIIDAWNDDRHHTKPISMMHLEGQQFFNIGRGTGFYLHDMLPLSKRYAGVAKEYFAGTPKRGVQYSVDAKTDADYMDAVNRGDMETAQRMLDEAAKAAGFTIKAYHGTRAGEFFIFDKGRIGDNYGGYNAAGGAFDFSTDEDWAFRWGGKAAGLDPIRTIPVYLKAKKTFYSYYGAVPSDLESTLPVGIFKAEKELAMSGGTAYKEVLERHGIDFRQAIMSKGYDSYSQYPGYENIAVYEPEQIKSADPVTYDDNGNVIPLSERFNEKNEDIRYSIGLSEPWVPDWVEDPTLLDADLSEMSVEQRDFFADSKARDEHGRLIPMYHGTNTPNFTVFDPSFSDDRVSLFFTSNPNVADTYTRQQDEGRDVDPYNLITEDSTAEQFNAAQERVGGGLRVVKVTEEWNEEMRQKAAEYEKKYLDAAVAFATHAQELAGDDDVLRNYFAHAVHVIRSVIESGEWKTNATLAVALDSLIYQADVLGREAERTLIDERRDLRKLNDLREMYRDSVMPEEEFGKYLMTETNETVEFRVEGKENYRFTHFIPGTEKEMVKRAIERSHWVAEHSLGNRYQVYLNLKNPLVVECGTDYSGRKDVNIYHDYHEPDTYYVRLDDAEDSLSVTLSRMELVPFIVRTFDEENRMTVLNQLQADFKAYKDKWGDLDESQVDHNITLRDVEVNYVQPSYWSRIPFMGRETNTRTISAWAKDNGYDGVIFKNLKDTGGWAAADPGASTVMIAFESNQVKATTNRQPTEDRDIRYSVNSIGEALNDGDVLTQGMTVTEDGKRYSINSMRHDIEDGKMFRDLMKHCAWTQEEVDDLQGKIEHLLDIMEPHRDILDMNETFGRDERKFSPYKENSDPLYKISLDFSTLCSKRLLTQYFIEKLQLQENRPMSAEEQMAIRDLLIEYGKQEKALQVACTMCYVEAARLKAPEQMNRWLADPEYFIRDYFGKKNKAYKAQVEAAQADFKESKGYDRNATKKQMSYADKEALNLIGPEMYAKYKPSTREQQIIEKAKKLPASTYLTADNLARLSESEPEIYDAYVSCIRSATRSKALETAVPYYYGDSKRKVGKKGKTVSDKFIAAVNSENGMRFSSWSDWRVQHLLDFITAVIENSVRGAAMHGYTKYVDEVRVLGKTGMMFNMSGVPTGKTGLDENGNLLFSETDSVDIAAAKQARNEFPETSGIQCIGVSDDHIRKLLQSDFIDYIIPYHVSGMNADLRRMGGIHKWKDYTDVQHAKALRDDAGKEPTFSEFFVGYDTGVSGIEAMKASAERYKRLCKERGLTPKFNDFAGEENYWKLLVDRKMVNQVTGQLIEQKPVKADFDFGLIEQIVGQHVENFDSGLESRALAYVKKNWDSIPSRIEELKKRDEAKPKSKGKKKKSTPVDRAAKVLANEALAAQPKQFSVDSGAHNPDLLYMDWTDQVDLVLDNRMSDLLLGEYTETGRKKESVAYVMPEPTALLQEVGLSNHPIVTTQTHLRNLAAQRWDGAGNVINEDAHELTPAQIKRIPELLRNPAIILKSDPKGNDPGGLVFFTEEVDSQGYPITLALKPSAQGSDGFVYDGVNGPAHFITAFGRKNALSYLNNALTNGDLVYADSKKVNSLPSALAHNLSGHLQSRSVDFDTILARITAPVNPEQRRYSVNPDTGYEKDSIQDKVLTLLKSGSWEDAMAQLQNLVDDLGQKETELSPDEKAFHDVLMGRKPVTEADKVKNRQKLDDLIEDFGAHQPGEKPVRSIIIPKDVAEGRGVSKYVRTVLESEHTPEWFVAEVERLVAEKAEGYTYDIATDRAAMNHVKAKKGRGFQRNLAEWEDVFNSERITKNDIALGEFLYTEAVKAGDIATATRLVAELSAAGTRAGQTVQAMSLLKKMTPSGQLYYLQKAVEKLNKDLEKQGKTPDIEIDADLAADLLDAETTEEMQAAMEALLQDIANKAPVTVMDKWNTWRYLAMLGNPRTHIRNIASNAVFSPAIFLKDVIGAVAQNLAGSKLSAEEHTKNLREIGESFLYGFSGGKRIGSPYVAFADADFINVADVLRGGGKQNPADLIRDKRPVFKSKATQWINTASKVNSQWMENEDGIFLKWHYVRALSQYLAAQNADLDSLMTTPDGRNQLIRAREWAVQEAQKATFREASAFASALSRFEQSNKAAGVLVGGLLPFKKTPINILKRGVEYSPLGIITMVRDGLNHKQSAARFVDRLAASLTGTGIMALGLYLASQGLLRGSGSSDDKEKEFEELQGAQNYALQLSDGTSFTIDWMAPSALPLFVGCEINKILNSEGAFTAADLADTLSLLAEPMFNLSMLDGLNNTLKSAGYSESPLTSVGTSILTGYVGQAVPTLLGQIARTIDGTRRTTYIDKNKNTVDWLDRTVQYNMTKVPGASQSLTPKLDAWGRTDDQSSFLLGALENFLSPGYINNKKTSPMEDELLRLYKATGESSVLPKMASKYFTVSGERYDLSGEEWTTFQKLMGQSSYQLLTNLVNAKAFQELSDAEKVKVIEDVYTFSRERAKTAVLPDYTPSTKWIRTALERANNGYSVEDFILKRSR